MKNACAKELQEMGMEKGGMGRRPTAGISPQAGPPPVPPYLEKHYWWAYVRPWALRIFERRWLINLILWGHYRRLRDSALDTMGPVLPGRTLQVACVYGDLSEQLLRRVRAGGGSLDVVDVLPIQLENLRRKLADDTVGLLARDASMLGLPDAAYDRAILYFLLHEQPPSVRERTLAEAFRVVKPGGSVIIVDFARPVRWHPLRHLWFPLLARLEPFAADLWRQDIAAWLPPSRPGLLLSRRSIFGGLYQILLFRVTPG